MKSCPIVADEAAGGICASADNLLNGDAGGSRRQSGLIVAQTTGVIMQP